MSKVAYIFPGQGTQTVGMGKEFYEKVEASRKIFDQAEEVVPGLKDIIFEGPQEKLTLTAYCQPAIVTVSMAAVAALKIHPKFQEITPCFSCGLSLGEYSALAAAEVFSVDTALRLVKKRSALMEEATKANPGTMAAVLGFDTEKLIDICKDEGAEIANFNSYDQVVITGKKDRVESACRELEKQGAKRVIPLDVSGAFHSSLMQDAAVKFFDVLKTIVYNVPKFPVFTNVDGLPVRNPDNFEKLLYQQITSSVQWVKTIENIKEKGVTTFLELGPGNVLKGLLRKIDRSLKVINIQTPEDIEKVFDNL